MSENNYQPSWMPRTIECDCVLVYLCRRSWWMEERRIDVGWRVTARVQSLTNFNIHPSPSFSSIGSLMEGGKERNLIGGKLPRSPWPEAGWGLQCVCPEGVGGEGSILAGHLGLGSQQHSLLSSSGSISLSLLGQCCLPPGDSHFFPTLCPASSDSFSLPNDPGFGHLLLLSVPSQGLWYSVHVPRLLLSPSVVWCTVIPAAKISA